MVAWTPMLLIEGSSSSSDGSIVDGKTAVYTEPLKCYVCTEYYRKPRILPCGHTFCAGCLNGLRETASREYNKTRDRNSHRRGDCGFFTCPWPNCHYSMKIMNVGRWPLKNKAVGEAVTMVKRTQREKQDAATQTDVTLSSVILTVPRIFFAKIPKTTTMASTRSLPSPLETTTSMSLTTAMSSSTTRILDHVVHTALSTDSVDRSFLSASPPPVTGGYESWKAVAAKIGMAILDQVLRQTI